MKLKILSLGKEIVCVSSMAFIAAFIESSVKYIGLMHVIKLQIKFLYKTNTSVKMKTSNLKLVWFPGIFLKCDNMSKIWQMFQYSFVLRQLVLNNTGCLMSDGHVLGHLMDMCWMFRCHFSSLLFTKWMSVEIHFHQFFQ